MIAVLLLGAGCFEGAPRRHPLDPQGENFEDIGGISIQVTTFYGPRSGISNATVRIIPGSFYGETDVEGRVFIPDLASGTYTLDVEKTGYAPQSKVIDVSTGETASVEIPMPGLPEFLTIHIKTIHISRWWPPPEELFRLQIETGLGDRDGLADIEEVWLKIPGFDYRETLDVQTAPGLYTHTILETNLPVPLSALLGQEMILFARDRTGAINQSEKQSIFRVIDASPLAVLPQGLELLDTTAPELTWEPISEDYPFSYQVDVVRVDNNIQNLILSLSDISSDSSSVQTTPLPSGEYFWTVSVVDEFGNLSRSKEAGFRIP